MLGVFTYRNMPRMDPTPKPRSHLHPHGQGYLPLQDDKIHYAGQPVAVVVAATLDQAAYAGTLIKVRYDSVPPVVFGPESAKEAFDPRQFLWPVASSVGNTEQEIASGAVRIEQTYTTADRHHNQMEPHATTAMWDADGSLTLYETTQHIFGAKELISIVLGMPIEKIAQMYSMAGHQPATIQPATIQTIALAADKDGKLTGIRHESISPTPVFDNYIEYAALASRSLWPASGGIATNHKIVHVNRNTPTAMRSPHEAVGHFALESAMDELAYVAGIDPVKLRLLNDTEIDPLSRRPFSTRLLRKCLTEGAARFGWEKRTPEPRSMREGRFLIGQGMAAAIYTHWRWPAKARVTINRDGSAVVETGTHELGTGTYTILQQVAADALCVAPETVTVRLGNTRLPPSHASIGSATVANAGSSVLLAAGTVREKAIQLAMTGRDAPFADAQAEEVRVRDGTLTLARRNVSVSYAELLARNGLSALVGDADYDPVPEHEGPKAIFSFAAVFTEVRVDADLGWCVSIAS